MGIFTSIEKLLDPSLEQLEVRSEPRDDDNGGEPVPKFRCRICGKTSVQKIFCGTCLADTMDPIKP